MVLKAQRVSKVPPARMVFKAPPARMVIKVPPAPRGQLVRKVRLVTRASLAHLGLREQQAPVVKPAVMVCRDRLAHQVELACKGQLDPQAQRARADLRARLAPGSRPLTSPITPTLAQLAIKT